MAPQRSKAAKAGKKIVIDVSSANAESTIFDVDAFTKYLLEHIKLEGKTGQLEDKITVEAKGDKVTITSFVGFSGKYAKYLTKRFLKKNELRDWLRVVATARSYYEVRFFNLNADEEVEDEDEDEDEDEE